MSEEVDNKSNKEPDEGPVEYDKKKFVSLE